MFDWFTGLSDALQVAFVSFVFTLISSVATITLTNWQNTKAERARWTSQIKRDDEVYFRSLRDVELEDQREISREISRQCDTALFSLQRMIALRTNLVVIQDGQRVVSWQEIEPFVQPLERIAQLSGLTIVDSLREAIREFMTSTERVYEDILGEVPENEVVESIGKVSSANSIVQSHVRMHLNIYTELRRANDRAADITNGP